MNGPKVRKMINLWDGYIITADDYQYILTRPKARMREGQEVQRMTETTYHPTLARALQTFYQAQMREYVRREDCTLEQAVTAACQVEERLQSMTHGL